jgi:hypothetical protein
VQKLRYARTPSIVRQAFFQSSIRIREDRARDSGALQNVPRTCHVHIWSVRFCFVAETLRSMDRNYAHRRKPNRALTTLDEAIAFVRKIGIVLRSPDPYLPSLFGAAQGEPFKPGTSGFGSWPAHAWWWDREISALPDIVTLKLIRGQTTFAAMRVCPAIDAWVRGRKPERFDEFQRELIAELRDRGPTPSRELNVVRSRGRAGRKLLRKARERLERRALLIGRPTIHGEHLHDVLLELWETRFPKPLTRARGIEPLLLACLKAAVGPVPVNEVERWLSAPRRELRSDIGGLVRRQVIRQMPDGALWAGR